MVHEEYGSLVHPLYAISKYITLPRNSGIEYRIAVPPVMSAAMLPQPDYDLPPLFKLVYRIKTQNKDGYVYEFIGAEL